MSASTSIKTPSPAHRSTAGITVVEIMIALVLFGIGVSLALRTLPESNVTTTRGRNMSKAVNLAQEQIETLMSIPFSDADLAGGTHTDPDNPLDEHFTRSWTVQDDTPIPGMKRVEVMVSYVSGSPDNSVRLTTLITSRR
jgi:Tfp pilus assembly protein PilV